MTAEVLVAGVAALPGLCMALAADISDRSRLRARAAGSPLSRPRRVLDRMPGGRAEKALAAVVGGGLGATVAGPLGAISAALLLLVLPLARDRRRRADRDRRWEAQLPQAAASMAAALRAGRSVQGAIEVATAEVGPPLGPSLRGVLDRVSLGTPLAEALESWAGGFGSTEGKLLVGVLRLEGRSGGGLPTALDRLASTFRARAAVSGEVRSLTAQARLSGTILGLLPIGFLLFMSVTSRRDLAEALQSRVGMLSLGGGLLLDGLAFLWIRRILRVMP